MGFSGSYRADFERETYVGLKIKTYFDIMCVKVFEAIQYTCYCNTLLLFSRPVSLHFKNVSERVDMQGAR